MNQSSSAQPAAPTDMETQILPVDIANIKSLQPESDSDPDSNELNIDYISDSPDLRNLRLAAEKIRYTNVPVAFPTETVYGLGADATRSSAVKGIYKAKQRPTDNPLIVHIASLAQLRGLLCSREAQNLQKDPIPDIYKPLVQRFWPGPLTIILPNPTDSTLAPEVTAGLSTFGARIPRNRLARALIELATVPLAAPSANASTRPSPTAAEHVKEDLDGRIELILDGGPCDVGLESTVVNGLSSPPQILRPGGISTEQIKQCAGWENVEIGYKNAAEGVAKPRAPGMKYRHYSPRARVILIEGDRCELSSSDVNAYRNGAKKLGIIRTRRWKPTSETLKDELPTENKAETNGGTSPAGFDEPNKSSAPVDTLSKPFTRTFVNMQRERVEVWDVFIGPKTGEIARQLFSVLRELDRKEVEVIIVEGIDEAKGDLAAAIANRLRKAAEVTVKSSVTIAE